MLTRTQLRIEPAIAARVNPGHPLARGLAGCWLLNEGAGRVARDASGHRHDGNFSGNPVWSPGLFGHAIEFDGVDDWISMGDCLDLGTDDVTLLAVARYSVASQPDSWSGYHFGAIAGKGYVDGSGTGYGLLVGADNRIRWQVRRQADVFEVASDGVLNDGRWRLAIAVCDRDDSAGMRLYIDGVRQSATADPTALNGIALNGSRAFAIGSRQDEAGGAWLWDLAGSVALVCVWKRVLAETEIRTLQQDPFGLFAPTRAISGFAASPGSFVQCTGSLHGCASTSASVRITRNLLGSSTASASVSGTLTVAGGIPLSGRVSGHSSLHASLCTTTPQTASGGMQQAERAWRKEALFSGMTPTAFKLGTALTQGWFWVRRRGCTAVYRGSGLTEVDLGRILYVAEPQAREIRLPAYLSHAAGSTHCYLVRRFNSCGDQDKTVTAAAVLRIGPDGQLAEPWTNAVTALTREQTGGTGLRLAWFYCPLNQSVVPVQFNVYRNGDPIGIVHYEGRRYYCYRSDALADGPYTFLIRAASEDGVEGMPSTPLVHQIATSAPQPAVILVAKAI